MDERERRVGENEALFREVNQRTLEVNEAFATVTQAFSVVCECGRIDCIERIAVNAATYEAVRADPAQFIVVPDHEIPDTEDVIDRGDGYHIVRKKPGGPAELAEALDPREHDAPSP